MSKFVLVAQESHTLPYAVMIDSESFESAVAKLSEMQEGRLVFDPQLLIDVESGEVKRVFKEGPDSWSLSDTAFEKLGFATPDEYFEAEA